MNDVVRRLVILPFSAVIFVSMILFAQTPAWKGKVYKDGDVTVVQNPKEPMFKRETLFP